MRTRDPGSRKSSAAKANLIDYRVALVFWSFGIPAGSRPLQADRTDRSSDARPSPIARETTKA